MPLQTRGGVALGHEPGTGDLPCQLKGWQDFPCVRYPVIHACYGTSDQLCLSQRRMELLASANAARGGGGLSGCCRPARTHSGRSGRGSNFSLPTEEAPRWTWEGPSTPDRYCPARPWPPTATTEPRGNLRQPGAPSQASPPSPTPESKLPPSDSKDVRHNGELTEEEAASSPLVHAGVQGRDRRAVPPW